MIYKIRLDFLAAVANLLGPKNTCKETALSLDLRSQRCAAMATRGDWAVACAVTVLLLVRGTVAQRERAPRTQLESACRDAETCQRCVVELGQSLEDCVGKLGLAS